MGYAMKEEVEIDVEYTHRKIVPQLSKRAALPPQSAAAASRTVETGGAASGYISHELRRSLRERRLVLRQLPEPGRWARDGSEGVDNT